MAKPTHTAFGSETTAFYIRSMMNAGACSWSGPGIAVMYTEGGEDRRGLAIGDPALFRR